MVVFIFKANGECNKSSSEVDKFAIKACIILEEIWFSQNQSWTNGIEVNFAKALIRIRAKARSTLEFFIRWAIFPYLWGQADGGVVPTQIRYY